MTPRGNPILRQLEHFCSDNCQLKQRAGCQFSKGARAGHPGPIAASRLAGPWDMASSRCPGYGWRGGFTPPGTYSKTWRHFVRSNRHLVDRGQPLMQESSARKVKSTEAEPGRGAACKGRSFSCAPSTHYCPHTVSNTDLSHRILKTSFVRLHYQPRFIVRETET